MAFPNNSAGVYDRDQDLSQRGSTVISSIGAIVVESAKGDTKEWTSVTDKAFLKSLFGTKDFKKYGFSMHCAEQFLTQSSVLVKRVVNAATARTAGAFLSVDDMSATVPVMKLVNFDDGTNQPQGIIGDPSEELGFTVNQTGQDSVLFYVYANSCGAWANNLTVRIRPSAPQGTVVGEYSDAGQFYVEVFNNYVGSASLPVESFLCSRKNELDSEGNQLFIEDRINANSQYIRVKNNSNAALVEFHGTVYEWLDGGADGDRATSDEIAAAWDGLEDIDAYSVQILINGGYTNVYVQQKMINIATARGDAIAVLDCPQLQTATAKAVNYRKNILNVSNSYGAMYAPFCQVTDDVSGRKFMCPPSGLVAAQYAYTDRVKAYYWAPAGLNRGQLKVTDLDYKYNLQERNALEQAQINVIRKIPGRGFVIFDAQTLQSQASGLQWVNVRRLVNGIKSVIRKAFLPSVFNPNDEFERLKLKNIVDAEAEKVKIGRGLYEYETICDERNNTTDVIANNDMVVDFVMDPEIPAKRVSLGADIRNYGASVSFTES